MQCDVVWSGQDAAMLACRLQSTNWPHIVITYFDRGSLYYADGLPSMLPVLETSIARTTGHVIPAADQRLAVLHKTYSDIVLKSGADDQSAFRKFTELGRLKSAANDYVTAETAYRGALEIEERVFGPDAVPVGEAVGELALQISNQGRFEEANALFRRASRIVNAGADNLAREKLSSYLALNSANQRRFDEALNYARQATAGQRAEVTEAMTAEASGGPPVSVQLRGELAHSLRIEAEMAMRLSDIATARAAANEFVWIVHDQPDLPLWWRADALELSAEVSAREGQVVSAERDFRGAVEIEKKLFGDGNPTADAELNFGAFYSGQQLYPTALVQYRDAFGILTKQPTVLAALQPEQVVPFIVAARANPDSTTDADIFRAGQLISAGVSQQIVARMAERRAAGNPALAELVSKSSDLDRKLARLRVDFAAEIAQMEPNVEKLSAINAELKLTSTQADALTAQIDTAFPGYARLSQPGAADLNSVTQALAPGEAFLSFVLGSRTGFALLVKRSGLAVRQIDISHDDLDAAVSALRSAMTPKSGRTPDFNLKASYSVYEKLLKPLEPDLVDVKHLIVAPGKTLASLPLSLLVTEPVSEADAHNYSKAAWLVRRMAISEVPSAGTFLLLRDAIAHRVPAPKPFLGVGDPSFARADLNLNASCSLGALPSDVLALHPLPETRREVQTVGASLGGSDDVLLLGERAGKREFLAEPLDQFRVIYIATHGFLPGELHCSDEPGLALALTPGLRKDTDAVLFASEISALKLNADLVVLSACNTAATGDEQFGGGSLEGLADAFFDAGAFAVIASHWEVPSKFTAQLMTDSFSSSMRDKGYAEALREAQLQMIANPATANPYNWAAFTLMGDGNASPRTMAENGKRTGP
jgi:CHAT domain-containing protein